MKGLILCSFVFIFTGIFAQLEAGYFTTYVNDDFTQSYLIYLPEDEVEDCFWVEYEVFDNYQSIFGESGIGVCDPKKDYVLMKFESSGTEKKVKFTETGTGHNLSIILDDGTSEVFHEVKDEEIFSQEEEYINNPVVDEVYYLASNGNLLTIFDDDTGLGFNLLGSIDEDECSKNQVGGTLQAMDEEGVLYQYKDGKCEISIEFLENGVKVTDKNCAMKTTDCPEWNGMYYFNE